MSFLAFALGLFEVLLGGTADYGNTFDPNGYQSTADYGSIWDPNG